MGLLTALCTIIMYIICILIFLLVATQLFKILICGPVIPKITKYFNIHGDKRFTGNEYPRGVMSGHLNKWRLAFVAMYMLVHFFSVSITLCLLLYRLYQIFNIIDMYCFGVALIFSVLGMSLHKITKQNSTIRLCLIVSFLMVGSISHFLAVYCSIYVYFLFAYFVPYHVVLDLKLSQYLKSIRTPVKKFIYNLCIKWKFNVPGLFDIYTLDARYYQIL
jgi:hypothetical protein